MMRKILVVGAGGIGSWLASTLYHLKQHKQLPDTHFTFADDDTVDTPNLSYQNFDEDDFMEYKVNSVSANYGFDSVIERITSPSELNAYTCVISCVDNAKFRKMLFTWGCNENPDQYWIDLRSEGSSIAAFTKHPKNTVSSMIATLGTDADNGEGGSCQRAHELNAGIVQVGNRIIAQVGAQLILNYIRKQHNPPQFIQTF